MTEDARHEIDARTKARLAAELTRRGLASFMNRTKWRELRQAVETELPFIPAWEAQHILAEPVVAGPGRIAVAGGHGWDHEDMPPYPLIEWLRMLPRLHAAVDGPLRPMRVVEDCGDALRAILRRLNIPFHGDAEGGVWVYGYATADPATLNGAFQGAERS